jgi:hypothetical protein
MRGKSAWQLLQQLNCLLDFPLYLRVGKLVGVHIKIVVKTGYRNTGFYISGKMRS